MGWVNLQGTTLDSFMTHDLVIGGIIIGRTVKMYVDPADFVVAQIALSGYHASSGVFSYIADVTLQGGFTIDLSHIQPFDVEYAWMESVTFGLYRTDPGDYPGHGNALATVTSYRI